MILKNIPGILSDKLNIKKYLPDLTILIIIITIVSVDFSLKYWNDSNKVIIWDIKSYYAYLPATFIQNDISLSFLDDPDYSWTRKHYWNNRTHSGKRCIVASMGLSILYSPFFFIAHIVAPMIEYENNGFSPPYKFALIISSMFYLIIGLFFLKKVLLKYFNEYITALVLLSIVLGTNLLCYTSLEAPMSHAYSFSMICMFLYYIIKWHENPNIKNTVIIGLLSGLIALIRPTNIITLLIFIFWDIKSWKEFQNRILFFIKSYKLILLMILIFFLVWTPQLLYWKYITGQFFYYSYKHVEGGFFFDNPQIINQLFSYRKGWLLYTPIMAFALIGIPFLLHKQKQFFLPVLIYILSMIYILSSWWSWWNGGSFGLRSYIDTYGILAIPLAALINWGFKQKKAVRFISILVIAILIIHSLFETKQYYYGAIHYDSMNKEAYWLTFGKARPTKNFHEVLTNPDYSLARQGIYVIKNDYPEEDSIALEDCINNQIRYIKNNKRWMKFIEQKAKKRNISTKEMLRLDAENMCKKKRSED